LLRKEIMRKTFIPTFITLAALIAPASASAACANPSINVATNQAIVTVGQEVGYSYSFCYNSNGNHYTAQVIQTQNGAGTAMNSVISPATDISLAASPGSVENSGVFTPTSAGRYEVLVAYYEQGQSAWETEGEALVIVRDAPTVPSSPVVVPPPATPVITPPVTTPPACSYC
jgi:hypothetical protein